MNKLQEIKIGEHVWLAGQEQTRRQRCHAGPRCSDWGATIVALITKIYLKCLCRASLPIFVEKAMLCCWMSNLGNPFEQKGIPSHRAHYELYFALLSTL